MDFLGQISLFFFQRNWSGFGTVKFLGEKTEEEKTNRDKASVQSSGNRKNDGALKWVLVNTNATFVTSKKLDDRR